jgi:hypothetical protein
MNLYENENNTDQEIEHLTFDQYREYKNTCEALLNQANSAKKLSTIPEFKEIVMDAYFVEEPKRLAGIMTSGRLSDKDFDACIGELRAIGSLRAFLQQYIQKGEIAQVELDNLEIAYNESVEERETIVSEGGM